MMPKLARCVEDASSAVARAWTSHRDDDVKAERAAETAVTHAVRKFLDSMRPQLTAAVTTWCNREVRTQSFGAVPQSVINEWKSIQVGAVFIESSPQIEHVVTKITLEYVRHLTNAVIERVKTQVAERCKSRGQRHQLKNGWVGTQLFHDLVGSTFRTLVAHSCALA